MSISKRKSKLCRSAAGLPLISDLSEAVGWILCPPDQPISQGWIVVTANDKSSGTLRRIDGQKTAQKASLQEVFGRSDRALLRLNIAPGTCFNIGDISYIVEKLEAGAKIPRVWVSSSPGGPFVQDLQKVVNHPLFAVCSSLTEAKTQKSSSDTSDSDSSSGFAPQLQAASASAVGAQALSTFLGCLQQPTAMGALVCASLHLVRDSGLLSQFNEQFDSSLTEAHTRDAAGLPGPEATGLLAFAFDEVLARKGLTRTDIFEVETKHLSNDQSERHASAIQCLASIIDSIEYDAATARRTAHILTENLVRTATPIDAAVLSPRHDGAAKLEWKPLITSSSRALRPQSAAFTNQSATAPAIPSAGNSAVFAYTSPPAQRKSHAVTAQRGPLASASSVWPSETPLEPPVAPLPPPLPEALAKPARAE